MNTGFLHMFFKLALAPKVVKRARNVALIVGVVLNIINQPGALFSLDFGSINFLKFGLTFMVPYMVSTYSSVMSKLFFEVGEVAPMNAKLKCKKCSDEVIHVNKGEVIPECKRCPDKTSWVILSKGTSIAKEYESEQEAMALFAEYNPAPVFRFDMNGTVLMSNPAANKVFEKEIVGEDVNQLVKQFENYKFNQVIENGEISFFVEEINSRSYRFEVRGVSNIGVCQVYGADISEVVAIKTENKQLLVAVEQTSNSIMITDIKGNIVFVNKAFEKVTGYKLSDVLGKNPRFQKTDHLSKGAYAEMWNKISTGNTWKGEFHNRKKNGATYWEEATITPILNDNGDIINYMAIKEDISARKQVRQELKSMALFAEMNPEPVFRFNKQGIVMKANPAASRSFERLNIQGYFITELLPNCNDIDFISLIDNAEILTVEEEIYDKIFRFILRGIPELNVCQIYGSDVTLRRKAEAKVRHQNDSIAQSIAYASRIQNAILPSAQRFSKLMPEHFILFKPRDVVSGDFYWMEERGNKLIIAAADCTGHGVPGAFMSMLGVSFLNEIVSQDKDVHANEILNQLKIKVKTTLSQSGKGSKDGMDMALVIIDFDTMKMQYSGAYNPLLLFRKKELIQYKADRMPIGVHLREKASFTNHILDIEKGDVFYMYSDGFVDQFGGDKKAKLSSKKFKLILEDIHIQPMDEQLKTLNDVFDSWKGDLNQIDDVLVMGGKI